MNMRPDTLVPDAVASAQIWQHVDMNPAHDARILTGGGSLARIMLDGQAYTLRITRQGKLILTK